MKVAYGMERLIFKDATIEDARFMLVSCSAFVNYLIAKYEKIEHKQDDDGSQEK